MRSAPARSLGEAVLRVRGLGLVGVVGGVAGLVGARTGVAAEAAPRAWASGAGNFGVAATEPYFSTSSARWSWKSFLASKPAGGASAGSCGAAARLAFVGVQRVGEAGLGELEGVVGDLLGLLAGLGDLQVGLDAGLLDRAAGGRVVASGGELQRAVLAIVQRE